MKLYLFEAGILKSEKHYFTLGRDVGKSFDVPVPFLLIDHPKGKVLFDTGNAFEGAIVKCCVQRRAAAHLPAEFRRRI